MHEMALAEGVIATALDTAREQARCLQRLVVRIGELQQIEPEVFRYCLDIVRPEDEPLLQGAEITLETERVGLSCRACRRGYGLDDLGEAAPGPEELEAIHFVPELAHSFISCPHCGSPDFEVVAGRGVWIERILVDA